MLRKAFLLASTVALLSQPAKAAYFKSGFIAGGHLGFSSMSGKFSTLFDDRLGAPGPYSAGGSASKTNFMGGIIGGYRHIFANGVSFGGDVVLNFNRSKEATKIFTQANAPFLNKFRRKNVSVIPGISVGKVLGNRFHGTLGLGLGISQFELQVINVLGNGSFKKTETKVGFVPSLGLEFAATERVSLVANVAGEFYSKVSKTSFGNEIAPLFNNNAVFYSSSYRPNFFTARLGFIVKI
ncbi:outer membrane beta-barrel protein [Candidatus Nucleicultrix amoebiphila]|jgi:opacity protein-like surface antigen|uniref:Outer membrane protein beta-barrel domain-containing protein n=1 Tax=Candidatus Nucleicultrix amoebiphila FS5 TaxID=1414854 RepID=A0A1W6N2N5_9PROT|nr:outer membrane beta-barrel protein [Candidatus Nucleicultrix amoebiphila]ARN84093.1 hypothetical protein GQ61_00615 [Candidatus Nucleicultrix amoebiphila FS5]